MAHVLIGEKRLLSGMVNVQPQLVDTDEIVSIEIHREGIGGKVKHIAILTDPPVYNVYATLSELKEVLLAFANSIPDKE